MDIQELFDIAKEQTSERFKIKFSEFIREHPQYSNLSQENRKIVFDLIYKHIEAIREGRGISGYVIQQEMHKLFDNRLKLKLTENDLKDIREMIELFKK